MMTLAVYPGIVRIRTTLTYTSNTFYQLFINSKFRFRQKLKHDD